jgi:hypothetical protein
MDRAIDPVKEKVTSSRFPRPTKLLSKTYRRSIQQQTNPLNRERSSQLRVV